MQIKFRCGKSHHTLSRHQEQFIFPSENKSWGVYPGYLFQFSFFITCTGILLLICGIKSNSLNRSGRFCSHTVIIRATALFCWPEFKFLKAMSPHLTAGPYFLHVTNHMKSLNFKVPHAHSMIEIQRPSQALSFALSLFPFSNVL